MGNSLQSKDRINSSKHQNVSPDKHHWCESARELVDCFSPVGIWGAPVEVWVLRQGWFGVVPNSHTRLTHRSQYKFWDCLFVGTEWFVPGLVKSQGFYCLGFINPKKERKNESPSSRGSVLYPLRSFRLEIYESPSEQKTEGSFSRHHWLDVEWFLGQSVRCSVWQIGYII